MRAATECVPSLTELRRLRKPGMHRCTTLCAHNDAVSIPPPTLHLVNKYPRRAPLTHTFVIIYYRMVRRAVLTPSPSMHANPSTRYVRLKDTHGATSISVNELLKKKLSNRKKIKDTRNTYWIQTFISPVEIVSCHNKFLLTMQIIQWYRFFPNKWSNPTLVTIQHC